MRSLIIRVMEDFMNLVSDMKNKPINDTTESQIAREVFEKFVSRLKNSALNGNQRTP
jgi:hypothetical protein